VFAKKSYLSSWVFAAMQSAHIRMKSSLSSPKKSWIRLWRLCVNTILWKWNDIKHVIYIVLGFVHDQRLYRVKQFQTQVVKVSCQTDKNISGFKTAGDFVCFSFLGDFVLYLWVLSHPKTLPWFREWCWRRTTDGSIRLRDL